VLVETTRSRPTILGTSRQHQVRQDMGRTIDQDVHAAFVEFKAKGIVILSIDCIVYRVTVTITCDGDKIG